MDGTLMAGLSAVDITPAQGIELAGYPHFPRYNTGAHDPLMATCLYLSDGEMELAVIGLDTLFFSKKHVTELRRRIQALCGMPGAHVMFCCSHTHSAPWLAGRLDMDALLAGAGQDEGYIGELYQKLPALLVSARRTAFACSVGYADRPCGPAQGVGGNRRDPEGGPSDPFIRTLSVRDGNGTVRGILTSYAVHPTLLHADNTLCSTDYPGYLRVSLREAYPHATMVFCLGAAGDQSSRYFRTGQTFAEAERFGRTLGEAARQAVEHTEYASTARLRTASATLPLKLRSLPARAVAEAHLARRKAEYDRLEAENAPYIDRQNANVALLGAEDILGYIELEERHLPFEMARDELPAEVSVIAIGDFYLTAMPGEVFMGLSQLLRQRAKVEKLLVGTVSNGCLPGYVYTREDAALGGYEVDTSMLDESAGYEMVDALAGLLDEVRLNKEWRL